MNNITMVGLLSLCLLGCGCLSTTGPVYEEAALEMKARDIHARILSVDTHCDTPGNMLDPAWDIGTRHEPGSENSGQIDLPRMKEGGLDALFFGVFTGQGPLTPEGYATARSRAAAQIDAVEAMTAKHHALVEKATTPADAARLKKEGKRAAFIGLENGYPIGDDLSFVETYARRGVRYITLCHSADNQICDSSMERADPEDRGLSEFGKKVVAECNRLGVMIDVSHLSDRSFAEVLNLSNAPVIATHSCCRALCGSPRNLTDDMIRALAEKGGVLQVCFVSSFLVDPPPHPERDAAFAALDAKYGSWADMTPDQRTAAAAEFRALRRKYPEPPARLKDVVDHIDHAVKLAGIDHVGIGTDFDGGGEVEDCQDVSRMYRVTMELLRRGYSEDQIAKIWGGNAFRVLQKVIDATGSSSL
ncbi:MAG: dipeptidase [Acidobacteriota bacterium]|nr:dipeptidase [Acidobacteriota bacterium]HNQ81896.1 dipeptidase [Candidatus Aminicenantes bacterium]MDD8027935.1 dipeptidase [Acidobacteriota bacterium]MDD8032254.1 dipeptidase [Acidobacteriota bacterium]MDD8038318.1 dipeptidase [Acidobacteriota bacterium]